MADDEVAPEPPPRKSLAFLNGGAMHPLPSIPQHSPGRSPGHSPEPARPPPPSNMSTTDPPETARSPPPPSNTSTIGPLNSEPQKPSSTKAVGSLIEDQKRHFSTEAVSKSDRRLKAPASPLLMASAELVYSGTSPQNGDITEAVEQIDSPAKVKEHMEQSMKRRTELLEAFTATAEAEAMDDE
eukprot:2103160-Rhodomonas_salina.1